MSKMREIDGYITVEASLIFPIAFLILFLFLEYAVYLMDCGIIQGIMEQESLKAADIVVTGGNYENAEISYGTLNQRNLYTNMFPGKNTADEKVKKQLQKELNAHLFLGKVRNISVEISTDQIKTQIKMQLTVPGSGWMKLFGIKIFEYEGKYQAAYLSEIEKARRWSVIERAMD